MTDREKLVRLIDEVADITPVSHGGQISYFLNSDDIADHLLAHGVTAKGKQRPLTIDELKTFVVYWFEERGDKLMPCEIGKFRDDQYTKMFFIGWSYGEEQKSNEYGKTWRCWAEKPTEEERKAAEWE